MICAFCIQPELRAVKTREKKNSKTQTVEAEDAEEAARALMAADSGIKHVISGPKKRDAAETLRVTYNLFDITS